MHNPENKTKALSSETPQTFESPANIQDKIALIVNEIKQRSERNLKEKEYFALKVQDTKERADEAVDFAQRLLANGLGKQSPRQNNNGQGNGPQNSFTPDTN